ncbi:hypothetical protein AMS68_001569 [Peltaster fructicola]|uniref:PXA domain-containing protein n=1 Tax=Peltaster fructicola TaxID=286661 RepID=A0A6H0XMR7_9PEZI|nr:hypothetical protein AMS68_001569 [Peltaster fructicola]
MAQGARRPLRHQRQSRQLTTRDAEERTAQSTRSSSHEDLIELEKIISILSSVSPEELRAARVNDQDSADYLRTYLRPITQSVDVDIELYALIAVIVSLCVHSWYKNITPDREINDKLVDVIAACLESVQKRLVKIDLLALLLDDIPALITEHLHALEFANQAQVSSADRDEVRKVYHAIRTHPALGPVPISQDDVPSHRQNQSEWCQVVVDKVLPLVLPPEDMHNPGLYVIVREIFSELILLHGVCEKLCESWFLWETITRVLTLTTTPMSTARPASSESPASRTVTLEHMLIWIQTAWHILLSAWCILLMSLSDSRKGITNAAFAPSEDLVARMKSQRDSDNLGPQQAARTLNRQPLLEMKLWTCAAYLTRIAQRMPWLNGGLSLLQYLLLHGPGKVGGQGSTLDRWLKNQIKRKFLQPSVLPGVLRTARQSLFPGGAFAPARPLPSLNEVLTIRQACGEAVLEAIPLSMRRVYFATTNREVMLRDVLKTVDLLADPYINKALIISIVELIVSQLFPELRAVC